MDVKRCPKCGETKPIAAAFTVLKSGPKTGMVAGWCRSCVNAQPRNRDSQRANARFRARYASDPSVKERKTATNRATYKRTKTERPDDFTKQGRAKILRQRYGITLEDFDALLAAQGGVCPCGATTSGVIVNGKPNAMCVDHDHATGAVRGVLCDACNRIVGLAGDDPARLEGLAAYLRRS